MKLCEYLKLAKKIVYKNYRNKIRDEEFVGEVASAVALADHSYKPGKSSLGHFRKVCVKNRLIDIGKRQKFERIKKLVYNANTEEIVFSNELRELIQKLPKNISRVLLMFLDGYSKTEIATELGLSKPGVLYLYKKGVTLLKEKYADRTPYQKHKG